MDFDLFDRTILEVVHGSHAYGTNVATSDRDVKGVCIPTLKYHLGFLSNFEQYEQLASKGHPEDKVVYSLQKFAKLATDCNPNIIEVLFVDDSNVIRSDVFGDLLRDFAPNFLSKKAKHTFSGYAHAQLKKINSHRSWLLNPPQEPPSRTEFGLSEESKVSKSDLGAFESCMDQGLDVNMTKEMVTIFVLEKEYQAKKRHWDQYQNWLKTRNPSRAVFEAKFGYDTKHANHLIRLMRMCVEILETGKVFVKRPDREELLAIRHGALSYEELIEQAEKLEARCDELYVSSDALPNEPNRKKIDEFIVNLTTQYLRSKGEI